MMALSDVSYLYRLVKVYVVLKMIEDCNYSYLLFLLSCSMCWFLREVRVFFSSLGGLFCCWVFVFKGRGLRDFLLLEVDFGRFNLLFVIWYFPLR